ncbi:MAG: wax ester/triacylglycerol synthase family O-acyltransferase [Sphingobium sp.]
MKRIQAADVIYLDAEGPQTPPLIGALIILDPATAPGSFVRHRDVLKYVEDRLHLAPNLRKRLIANPLKIDEPRMVDDVNFDLEFHVRHLGLPRPRDRRQLNILAARLMSRPMDMARPLWELYIIEGIEAVEEYPEDAFAVMIKLHHAAFDGAAAVAAIWAMLQSNPNVNLNAAEGEWKPENAPGALDWAVSTMREAVGQFASNIQVLPKLGANAIKGTWESAKDMGALTAPKTRFQGEITSHRVFEWVIFPQSDFRAIREALGKPKMNDVVLCVIAGAMRRYLSAKGELPKDSLLAVCPINVRGSGDAKDGGNHVSAMRVALGTDIADPVERTAFITACSEKGKKQAEKLGGTFFGDLMALYPYPLRAAMIRGAQSIAGGGNSPMQLANLIVTNIPNPRGEYYFAGSKVLAYAGFGPVVAGYGLFHTVAGMEWEMSISVTSCREIMPDIAFYMQCLQESFEELKQLAPPSKRPAQPVTMPSEPGSIDLQDVPRPSSAAM